jgi:F-type H+-transporting ATPase subunit b
MEAILHTFGIDWRLLLVNAVNFGLLLAGLTYFLYKPMGRMLEERRQKVEKGVRDAEAAEVKLREIEESRKETLAKAGEEADQMLAQSRKTASEKAKELMNQAEAAAARAIAEAEAEGGELKNRAIQESKEEVARMIVLGIEKLAKNSK